MLGRAAKRLAARPWLLRARDALSVWSGAKAHPHYEQAMAISGLVQDGITWTRKNLETRWGGVEGQLPVDEGQRSPEVRTVAND